MFGFTLQKLLVLAAIVGAVWYGFKLVSRLQEARKLEEAAARQQRPPRRSAEGAKSPAEGAEDMVQCPVCRTFVAARAAGNCGRSDCPY